MIDVLNEDLLHPKDACRLRLFRNPRTGKDAHLASMYRYMQVGARAADGRRIRLETVKTPAGLVTSRQAVERFIRALTDPDTDPALPTDRERIQQINAAKTRLAAAGM